MYTYCVHDTQYTMLWSKHAANIDACCMHTHSLAKAMYGSMGLSVCVCVRVAHACV